MTQLPQPADIDVKLTYNNNKHVPRNFFIHLFNVPLDAAVRAEYKDDEIPIRMKGDDGSVHYSFWIASDTHVTVTISQGDVVLNAGEYLVHNDEMYSRMFVTHPFKGTLSVNYMR